MNRQETRLADLAVTAETRRTIEASLISGASGVGFIALQASLTALAIILLVGCLGLATFAAVSALAGDEGLWRLAGFSLLFAAPIALFLAIQVPFLLRLRRGL